MSGYSAAGPPVVVLGMARSGTSLLREMLNHHSELAIPPESYFLMPLWDRFRAGHDLGKLLADLAFAVQVREWGVDADAVRARIPRTADFPDVIRAVYECYAESRGKRRFGDKTPLYMLYLELLEHAFSRPVYVHIMRDVRDAALSYAAMPSGHPRGWLWPAGVAEYACRWRSQVGRARRFGSTIGPDRYVELRYEDLVQEPERRLREVCDRIGLTFEDSMLEYYRDADVSTLVNHRRLAEPPSPSARTWREAMRADDVERVEAVAGELLDELGYDRAFPRPSTRARARMLVADAASSGKLATMRLTMPLVRRSPVWRWRQSRVLRRSGLPVPRDPGRGAR